MADDFRPGDVLHQRLHYRGAFSDDLKGPYTVLDPVRTKAGKLRLRGPRGGYMTTWWRKEKLRSGSYTLTINQQEDQ